ncbi:M949_RS01915 family surface polysaccharide biosynthesis protein [Mariniflexile ostreae]
MNLKNKSSAKALEITNVKNDSLIFHEKWNDKSGENIFKIEKYVNYEAGEGENIFKLSVSLQNSFGLTSIKDSILDCPVETDLNFIAKSFELSDIDDDGFKEISFVYNKYCRGDISGDDLLLLCIDKNTTYFVKGYRTNKAFLKDDSYDSFGEMQETNMPKRFEGKMSKKWLKYSNEDFTHSDEEVNNHYHNLLKNENEKLDKLYVWQGTYSFDFGGFQMGEEYEGTVAFKIEDMATKVSFNGNEELLNIVGITKDTLQLEDSGGDIFKIYKDDQGYFNVSGHRIYMLSPPNKSQLLTKEE